MNANELSSAPVVALSRASPATASPLLKLVALSTEVNWPPAYSAVPSGLSARSLTKLLTLGLNAVTAEPSAVDPVVTPGFTLSWTSPLWVAPFTVVNAPPTYTVLLPAGPATTVQAGPSLSTGTKFGSMTPVPAW